MKHTEIGPISEGTMRTEHLIPTYLAVLREHSEGTLTKALEACEDSPLGTLIHSATLQWDCADSELEDYRRSNDAGWDMETLTTALEEIAPPLCYFGAQEGDGACYGFWVCESAVQDAKDDPDTHVGPGAPTDPSARAWLEINERGNLTYRETTSYFHRSRERIGWKEIWSCV